MLRIHREFGQRVLPSSVLSFVAACAFLGCSGTDTPTVPVDDSSGGSTASTGGATSSGSGGTPATGGSSQASSAPGGSTSGGATALASTGGVKAAGGASATGGARVTGGANALGGTAAIGGTSTKATGGLPATGGSSSVNRTGGAPAIGGTTSTGGASSTGGTKITGGAAALGGTTATGGSKSTGGATATGGASGTAGASSCGAPVPADASLLSSCTGTSPIICTLVAPNGNWDVTVQLGDPSVAGSSRVQSETRHYENNETATAAGVYSTLTFTANVRAEVHDGGQSAPGNILNLVIDGAAPKLHALGIRSSSCAITIFVAGDSTVCDWVSTNTSALAADETGWAQELSLYLKPGVSVANYADSGETAGSFYTKFFPAARTAMKAGDYLFIQFGHNDQKTQADIDAYAANLTKYVNDAKAKGAIPVIFTPVSRASGSAANPGFAGLDQVARDTAAQLNVALVDLTALSRAYYQTVPSFSSTLFIDGTHFHEVGAIGVAGVVATALKSSTLGLSGFIR